MRPPRAAVTRIVRLIVNGIDYSVTVEPHARLLWTLRDEIGLTGPKAGCEVGVCGACTVVVDGRMTSSCIMLTAQVDGCAVTTVEGIADQDIVCRLQQAFVDHGGFQCGFCTSGQIVTAAAFLSGRVPGPISEQELTDYMEGNLCRCTGYYGIRRAIRAVGEPHAD